MASKGHVIVIGAGVTGLTSAIFLAEAGYKVHIVAAHGPGDQSIEYTSPWGGAQWRTHAVPGEAMCEWDMQTYEYWIDLMRREEGERGDGLKSGLRMYDSILYWDGDVNEELWWKDKVQSFKSLTPEDEPLKSVNESKPDHAPAVANGASFRAMTINVPKYLPYLQKKAEKTGVEIIKAKLPSDNGLDAALAAAQDLVPGDVDVYINATGINASKLCNDNAVYPIRGQTVLVKGEAKAIHTRIGDGVITYCLPRHGSGTSILGGTKQKDDWNGAVDEQTTREILERCSCLVPELQTGSDGGFEVVSVQVGLRPGRKGGPRVEREEVGDKKVVHAYGHAGAGYQNSIGSARVVVRLVGECLGRKE